MSSSLYSEDYGEDYSYFLGSYIENEDDGSEFYASSSVEEEEEDEDDVQPYSYFGNNSFEDDQSPTAPDSPSDSQQEHDSDDNHSDNYFCSDGFVQSVSSSGSPSEEEYEEGIYCDCDSFKDSQRPADPYNPTNSQDEDLDNFSSEPETDDVVETDEELELFFPFFNDDLSLTEKCPLSSVESFEGGVRESKLPEKELSKTAPSFPAKKVLYDGLVYVGYEIESTNKCGDRSNTDRFK